jgi:hypothetical protein
LLCTAFTCSGIASTTRRSGMTIMALGKAISLQHLEFPVARDRADLGNVQPLLEQSRVRLVPQIVKMKVTFRARTRRCSNARRTALPVWKHLLLFDAPDAKLLQRLDRRDNGTSRPSSFLVTGK